MPILDNADLSSAKLFEGQVATTEPSVIRTGINADTAILVFGRALVKGTGDDDLILPAGAGGILLGIAMATDTIEKRTGHSVNSDGDMGYPVDYAVSYLIRGVIGVKVGQAVTPASNVFYVHTAFTGAAVGTFRADANTDKAAQITNARFLASGGIGSVVPLSINLF